jgi:hypothetical protein
MTTPNDGAPGADIAEGHQEIDRNKEMIGNRIRPEVKFGLDVLGRLDRKINKPTDKVEDEVVDQQVADAVADWRPSPTNTLATVEGVIGKCVEYVYLIDIGDVEKNLAIQYKATILDHLDAIHDLIEKWEIQ